MLADRELVGDAAAWQTLTSLYGGNPLALKVVGHSIPSCSGGRSPLSSATRRPHSARSSAAFANCWKNSSSLSALEQTLAYWLAVEREPVPPEEVAASLGPGVGPGEVLEALEALRRRSLLERATGRPGLTLQPVVLEM